MITKGKLLKLIDDNLDVVYSDEDMDSLLNIVNEIFNTYEHSTIKEKLYKEIIKRELKEKYEEDRYGIRCIACGKYNPVGKEVSHYRRCPTGQIERVLAL